MSVNTLAVEAAANAGAVPKPPSQDDRFAALTKYIPTESVTLYVATVSSQAALASLVPWLTPGFAYWFFVALTPFLALFLTVRKVAVAGKDWRKLPLTNWPWWQMAAATIAFAVWALAIPGNPLIPANTAGAGAVAGLAAIMVSTLLALFAPLFERPAKA